MILSPRQALQLSVEVPLRGVGRWGCLQANRLQVIRHHLFVFHSMIAVLLRWVLPLLLVL